ncbi:MFS transporter [Kytococcus sedentarius]|uniref:Arabinose efflux permease family protein n=1 Tax=Kytococcus sedentarius (strain ATCC 14392 / DSM 20547 / JCM 11482 / CCUG 33030 / NBRC 15357 / NCTC 11040 / CCM 314 / 541) TaxID=478801 RepID=C7NJJ3_KYTSD|nr:MFS transporter [Kytococcus sedentarius]ACV05323.1 arabinose efflux permease family protein [Kytococcus sedentarius DSM 20547]QQB63774.1 MFS transporter [Kytococcus sedentarius]
MSTARLENWGTPLTPGGPTLRQLALSAYAPMLLWSVALAGTLPVLPLIAMRLGATAGQAALIVALQGVAAMAVGIPAGMATERIGERRAMTGAGALSALAMLLVLTTSSLAVLSLGVVMLGCSTSVFMLARQSYLTSAFPRRQLARAMSTLGGMARIGFFVGPMLGALAIWQVGVRGPVAVSLALLLVLTLTTLWLPRLPGEAASKATRPPPMRGVITGHWRTFTTLGVGVVLCAAARGSRTVIMPLWGHHIGVDDSVISLIVGLAGLLETLTFYPAGVLMDRVSRRANAIPSMAILGAGIALVPLSGSALTLALAAVVIGFGNGLGSGLVMTLSGDVAPEVGRTSFLAVMRTLADGGNASGPLVISGVTVLGGLGAAIVVAACFGFGASAAFARWVPRGRPG